MKELKNKIDSIRRALKTKNIAVPSAEIESKILELCSDFPDDWCFDIRSEVIKALISANQSSELSAVENLESLSVDSTEYQNTEDAKLFQTTTPLESLETESLEEEEEVNAMPTAVNYALSEISQAGELLAVQDKADLVASTAESMGIQLQLSEVDNIASNLDYSGDSLNEGIGDIRSAITAFVEYKAQINQQKINHMIGEVRAAVNQHNQQTSQHLNNGLSQIAKDINQADTDFKSSVRQALKCFAIPANKAG
jgi:hypothetical protein